MSGQQDSLDTTTSRSVDKPPQLASLLSNGIIVKPRGDDSNNGWDDGYSYFGWRYDPELYYGRPSSASQRPYHEPPVLDYRCYEEVGDMYCALCRHPKATVSAEDWYKETDAATELDLFKDYSNWVHAGMLEAMENGDAE